LTPQVYLPPLLLTHTHSLVRSCVLCQVWTQFHSSDSLSLPLCFLEAVVFISLHGKHVLTQNNTRGEEEEEGQEEEDMLLGKRPRPPIMKRTTSMSGGMAVESPTTDEELVSDNPHHHHEPNIKVDPLLVAMERHHELVPQNLSEAKGSSYELYGQRSMGMVIPLSPTTSNNPRHSHNHTTNTVINTTSHFLRTCGLCKCRLAPDRRDIYMYRYVHVYWV